MPLHTDPVIALLRDLVAIDSVNPSLVPGAAGELAMARRVADEMRASGLAVEIHEAAPGRPNVIGTLAGRGPGRTLMLCGHTDTVGVAGMARPFDPELRDGRLYGRGAQDMKGGIAAMLSAARTLANGGGLAAGRLIVAAVVDEEHSSVGADALVTTHRADGAVVTEPTGLDVAVAHKGFQWVSVETRGRAAHGSRPREGRDAILRMGRVLAGLEALDRRLQAGPAHPLLGTASLHASLIHGGRELSSYPDRAWLEFERRALPGEPITAAHTEVTAILDTLRAADPEFDAEAKAAFGRDAYEIDPASPLPGDLVRAATAAGAAPRLAGMTFWTDAAILGGAGIPAVLFGPGGAGLHSTEEYVIVEDVCRCRDALVELARAFTGKV
ncbi:MAG TPA: M20/M25/M40 family metallo-hydrolase [Vicinamibacterales bacterium]|nr:M20/M25/M40 family metallo-hydrolase [Vicinamibacterales bacterium]